MSFWIYLHQRLMLDRWITFETGLTVSRRYGYQHYDAMIIAAALQAGCERLYSEDMQHQQIINKRLEIVNPFV